MDEDVSEMRRKVYDFDYQIEQLKKELDEVKDSSK